MRKDQLYVLAENQNATNQGRVVLHENILDVLFEYKKEMYMKLVDLRGMFFLDHMAIKIIDPDFKMIIFSMFPSVEYDLIVQDLWRHDLGFSINFQKGNDFYEWRSAYSKFHFQSIKNIKETKHGFTCGFNIPREIGGFQLIYSYATRSTDDNLLEFYRAHKEELRNIGDYVYRLVYPMYQNSFRGRFAPPRIRKNTASFLKLIVDNE